MSTDEEYELGPIKILATQRHALRKALAKATNALRVAVVQAADDGVPEAVLAREIGMDRMSVRAWRGKTARPYQAPPDDTEIIETSTDHV